MTDPFRELKKIVDRGFDGMLPCVEVDKGIICGDFGKFEKTSTVKVCSGKFVTTFFVSVRNILSP